MLYINSSVTCLKFAPKWSFSYFQPILAAIVVTIARALIRILKTGVPEPSLPKIGCPTIQKNIDFLKKKESQYQKWEFRTANRQLVRALIATVKVKSMPDFYTLANVLIN